MIYISKLIPLLNWDALLVRVDTLTWPCGVPLHFWNAVAWLVAWGIIEVSISSKPVCMRASIRLSIIQPATSRDLPHPDLRPRTRPSQGYWSSMIPMRDSPQPQPNAGCTDRVYRTTHGDALYNKLCTHCCSYVVYICDIWRDTMFIWDKLLERSQCAHPTLSTRVPLTWVVLTNNDQSTCFLFEVPANVRMPSVSGINK